MLPTFLIASSIGLQLPVVRLCGAASSAVGCERERHGGTIVMGTKQRSNTASRRNVLDGSAATKAFYDPEGFRSKLPPGWSPALVVSLGAVAASYGSSARSKLFEELQELSSGGAKNQGAPHLPAVELAPGRKAGQVSVTISAAANGAPDAIDYIWARDAQTGEIFIGRRFLPKEAASLSVLVDRGRRVVPCVHSTSDGVWEGEPFVAN